MGIIVLINAGAALLNTVVYFYTGKPVSLCFAVFSFTIAAVFAFKGN